MAQRHAFARSSRASLLALILGAGIVGSGLMPGSAAGQALRSDFDGNGSVDFEDFLLFAQAYGSAASQFDLDGRGSVDFPDFLLFAADYSAGQGSADGPAWKRIDPIGEVPDARLDHSLIHDPVENELILFGGRAEDFLGDTWVFDLDARSWRQVQTSPSPDPRRGHAAVYDAPRRRMVIFGGQRNGFFNDVWAFDLDAEQWTELTVSGEQPVPRYGTSAVLDSTRGLMVVSHGFSAEGRFDDTWEFDLSEHRWLELTPASGPRPLNRCLHDAVYDAPRDRMLLFGGCSSGYGPCPQGDLWSFDLETNRWTQLDPPGTTPDARSNLRLNVDPSNGRVLMFGGGTPLPQMDLWAFSLEQGEWDSLSVRDTTPSARWSHEAVMDPSGGRLLLFGGTNGAERFNDLWALQL